MGRRLFGARKRGPAGRRPTGRSCRVHSSPWRETGHTAVRAHSTDARHRTASPPPEEELLERIAAFRSAVSDSLYEISKDYQMLCNLTHADLTACDEIIAELRRRLAGNIHYDVLAKLDDVHALVAAHIGGK